TFDELYVSELHDEVRVFLTAWWKGKPEPMGYTKSEGAGRVAYLANGHTVSARTNPEVSKMIIRAGRWANGEDWSAKTIKRAAMGYGGAFDMGRKHMQSCQKAMMQPVAVCDRNPDRTATARAELGEIQTFSRAQDLLSQSDADLISIITPHNTHAQLSIQCLE